jgi:DivIVA domain-containing protein
VSEGQRFRRRALRRGYKVDEVDSFLDRVEATLAGDPMGAPVTAGEVHDVVFRVRFGGYDEWQVDLHLDRVERQLADLEERGGFARGGDSRPAAPMREDRFAALREEQRAAQPMPMRPVGASLPGGPMGPPPPMPGGPMGAPAMAQMQGPPLPQRPLNGAPMDGHMDRPPHGQPMPGQPMPGQPMPGQPMPGQPMSGPPLTGQVMPGQPMPGGPMDRPLPPYQGDRPMPGPADRSFPPDRTLPPGMMGPISGPPYGDPMSSTGAPLPQRPVTGGPGPMGGMTPPPVSGMPPSPVPPHLMSQAPMSPPASGGPGFARFDDTAFTPGGYGAGSGEFEQQRRRDFDAPPAGRPGFDQPSGARPGFDHPSGARPGFDHPSGARPGYDQPSGIRPGYDQPSGARPGFDQPSGARPGFDQPSGARPGFDQPSGGRPGFEPLPTRSGYEQVPGNRHDYDDPSRHDYDSFAARPDDAFAQRPGMDSFAQRPDDSFAQRPDDSFAQRPDDSFAQRPGMDSFAQRPDDSFAQRPGMESFPGRPDVDSFAGRPDYPMPTRHGRPDMTSEIHMPPDFSRFTGNSPYGGGNGAYAAGNNGYDGAYNGNGAYGGVDTLSPAAARIDELRRTFTPRRFGSGYDASQVNRLFDAIIASLSGQSGTPIAEAELDPNQFSLVPGGYFEAEVEQALRQIRDLIR